MKTRLLAVFADAPIVFFAVVFGVALTFRVAVGVVRDAAHPEPVAPTFATTAPATGRVVTGPEPGLPSGTAAATSTAEVGAAAKVQPIGSLVPTAAPIATITPPARLAPKPRGHLRRPPAARGDR